jgi:hypothetical protein
MRLDPDRYPLRRRIVPEGQKAFLPTERPRQAIPQELVRSEARKSRGIKKISGSGGPNQGTA